MTYDTNLPAQSNPYPWRGVLLLPNMQRVVAARFYRRSDADGYVWVFRQMQPELPCVIVFDLSDSEDVREAEIARLERSK